MFFINPNANVHHNSHMHIHFLQLYGLYNLLELCDVVTHHIFPSTSCFCASCDTPNATEHEYMQMCESHYASDLSLVQSVSFNGPLAIELHDV